MTDREYMEVPLRYAEEAFRARRLARRLRHGEGRRRDRQRSESPEQQDNVTIHGELDAIRAAIRTLGAERGAGVAEDECPALRRRRGKDQVA